MKLKTSRKISSFLMSVVIASLSTIPSKAVWHTVGDNVNKERVVQDTKRNWCWAYSGAKLLEYLGVTGINAGFVAMSAGHNLNSDRTNGLISTLNAVRNLLPAGHRIKNSNFLSLQQFNDGKGQLVEISNTSSSERRQTKAGYMPVMTGILKSKDFSEIIFLLGSLQKRVPILASFGEIHVVLVTGLEPTINKIRYWDLNRGEVEENFGEFTNKRVAYATFS